MLLSLLKPLSLNLADTLGCFKSGLKTHTCILNALRLRWTCIVRTVTLRNAWILLEVLQGYSPDQYLGWVQC